MLLNVDHESWRAPPANGHEGVIWYPHGVPVNSSAKADRVCPGIFWGKPESGHAHLMGLGTEDCDNIRGADGAEPLAGGRIVADQGGVQAPMILYAVEDVDTRSD